MRKYLFGILAVALCTAVILHYDSKRGAGVESTNIKEMGEQNIPSTPISFEFGSKNIGAGVYIAYTDDPESLWNNKEWVDQIREKMIAQSKRYDTVLLFSSEDKSPNVEVDGMRYPQSYDQYSVCGYWRFPTGATKFCYGGMAEGGNWVNCE